MENETPKISFKDAIAEVTSKVKLVMPEVKNKKNDSDSGDDGEPQREFTIAESRRRREGIILDQHSNEKSDQFEF